MTTLTSWLKQPTTINGIGALVGVAGGAVAYALTHSGEWAASAALVAGGIVHIAMPDNSAEQSAVEKLTSDAVNAAIAHRLNAALPELLGDGLAVMKAAAPPAVANAAAPAPVPAPAA